MSTGPKKVFYVWDYLEWGGAQVHLFAVMAEVKKHFPVMVIIPEGSDDALIGFLDRLGVPYEFFPFHRDLKLKSGLAAKLKMHRDKLRMERRLVNFLARKDLSDAVLHIDLAPWQSYAALRSLCARAGQVFVTMHNRVAPNAGWRRALWKRKLARLAGLKNFHILASNKDAANALRGLAPDDFVDRIRVTYTSINPPEIEEALRSPLDREALCRKFNLPADKFIVLCLGQFIDRKGRWTFLEAAQKLTDAGEQIQFVWISNSVLTAEDRRRIDSYGLGDSFSLIANETIGSARIDLFRVVRLAGAFVLPSFTEGLPIALLEAMALRVPSISTNINGIPEAIFDRDTGLLIKAGDAGALAAAVLELKNDAALRARLAENGRAIVLREFDEREAAKIALGAYLAAFEQAAAEANGK